MTLFQDEDDDVPVTLKVAKGSPTQALTLVRRMALRDPDLTAARAQRLARAAGLRISPASVSYAVADVRAIYRLIEQAGLLRRDADDRRRALDDDLVPIKKRRSSGR